MSTKMDERNADVTQLITENVDEEDDSLILLGNETSSGESGLDSDDDSTADVAENASAAVFMHGERAMPLSIYESLDYDVCENRLWVKDQKPKLTKLSMKKDFVRWIICLMIGVLTALVAASIDIAIEEVSSVKFGFLRKMVQNMKINNTDIVIPFLYWVLMNVVFTTIGSLLVTYIEPVAAGSGIPQVKCYLNGVKVSFWAFCDF